MGPELIPLFGMLTGIITISVMTWGLVQVFRGPVGQAISRKLHGQPATGDPDLLAAVDTLREQVESLQRQLDETQERLEFTERLMLRERSSARKE